MRTTLRAAAAAGALALVVLVAPVAHATAPPVAGAEPFEGGWAVPVSTQGPAWFDRAFADRIIAAGTKGVRAPAGATFPDGSTPAAVGLAMSGIRPGTWLINLDLNKGFAWCTANFVFRKSSSFGLGTAGHCAAKDALPAFGSDVAAYVVPPPAAIAAGKTPGFYHIGRFVLSRNNGIGDDFAMVGIYSQYNTWMNPTMPVWGGPIGIKSDTTPTLVTHFGHGAVVGTGGTPRAGVAPIWTARNGNAFAWYGVGTPGDSGSAVDDILQHAAGNFTHIVIYDGTKKNAVGEILPGMLAGTRITHILQIANGWTLVNGSIVGAP